MKALSLVRVAATVVTLALPSVAAAQAFATMPLSTKVPEAAAAVREGLASATALHPAEAARHYAIAVAKDPSFALARALHATTSGTLSREERIAEAERAFADLKSATLVEAMLVMQAREGLNGRGAGAQAINTTLKALLPEESNFANAGLPAAATPQEAVARARANVEKYRGNAQTLNALAYALWGAGDKSDALETAKKQVEQYGKQPNPHDSYAELLQWNGDLDGAATHYGHAVAMAPSFSEGYAGLAEVAALRGDFAGARRELARAIANTDNPTVKLDYMRQVVGTWAIETNNAKGLAQLKEVASAAAARGDTGIMVITAGQIAAYEAVLGNADAAHASAGRALAMRPKNQAALYFAAMSHAVLKHYAPAAAAIATARAEPAGMRAPASNRLMAAEAYIAIQQEKPKDALAILEKADATDLVVLSWMARANQMLGDTQKANAQFTSVRDNRDLDLTDFAAANARGRARTALAAKTATRNDR